MRLVGGVLVAATIIFAGAVLTSARAQSPNITVSVTGSGPSIDDAKADAIRQALQLTMKQLVVVDRAISGDNILRDKVMSTMNGYIERFQQKNITRTAVGFAVNADITVSASRIENFIGVTVGGGGQIEGSTLLSEQNRRFAQIRAEQDQAKARGEIFDRLFRGFPSSVIDIRVLNIALSQRDPNILQLQLEYSYKESFIRALESTLKALAVMECGPIGPLEDYIFFTYPSSARYAEYCRAGQTAGPLGPGPVWGRAPLQPEYNGICLRFTQGVKCYALAPGNYCASCALDNFGSGSNNVAKQIVIIGRFVDASGRIAGSSPASNCIGNAAIGGGFPQTFIERRDNSVSNGLFAGFDFISRTVSIEINTSFVSLENAKFFVAIAGLALPNQNWNNSDSWTVNRWVTSLVPDIDYPTKGGCQLLDEAVQRQMLSRSADLVQPKNSGAVLGLPLSLAPQ